MNSPSVTITSVSTGPPSKCRISPRSMTIPATNESAIVVSTAHEQRHPGLVQAPGDEGAEHRHLALGEVHDPGGAEDQHEGQGHRGVDRARGEPVDEYLDELLHQ